MSVYKQKMKTFLGSVKVLTSCQEQQLAAEVEVAIMNNIYGV